MFFFKVNRWPTAGFPMGSRAHVRLEQDRVVLRPD